MKYDSGQNVALMCGAKYTPREELAIQQEVIVGFLPRTLPKRNLILVLKFISTGQSYAPPKFIPAQGVKSHFRPAQQLSLREVQALTGIVREQTNREIVYNRGLKKPTIKLYAKNLFCKLHVENRAQAALIAKEHFAK